ncbi:MAG: ABC transporter permease [Anaerolineales bacterium]|nr:ABC transporter permease [Anaerolineales bacterium]MDW8162916.1 ABC transporter permease [Anaerolineales bacterium]
MLGLQKSAEAMSKRWVYDTATLRDPALEELFQLWRYRDLLHLLVVNRIKTRYKRSVLGVVWTLLNPLLNTLVLTIVFSQIFHFDVPNYPIYILSGLLFWNFFAQSTLDAMDTLVWGSSLLKRIYIPRTIFAVAVVGNGLVNYLLALIPLGVIMLVLRHPFTLNLAALPLAILILATFTLGMGLLLSTLAVFFVDLVYIFNVLLLVWFYLTPIIYPLSILPERFLPLFRLNPLLHLLQLFRRIIYEGTMPSLSLWGAAFLLALVALGIGWIVFTRKADEFAYRI